MIGSTTVLHPSDMEFFIVLHLDGVQDWGLGWGVWPASCKWVHWGGPRQNQESVKGKKNVSKFIRDFQWISGGLWSSIWKAREPKDPKNLQGLKLKRKTHPIDIHKPPGWVQHPSEDNDAGGARREIRKSHQIQDCCWKNLAGLLLSHTHCVWKQ